MVRGLGYIKSLADIEVIPVATNGNGTPILVRDLATVTLGPDLRRGIATLDDKGEVVGGIVVMRYGENALNVIRAVKAKLKEIEPSLPPGVKIVPTYDRSTLIMRAIETLRRTITEELVIVSAVILIFLWHIPSAIIPIITIPIAIILSFIPMDLMRVTANIMSLGGIAVAIGAMVDAAIVVVEQTHKKLEHWQAEGRKGDYREVVISAVKEVGGPSFFALLVIAVSFIPVFALEAQEGRLFKPLAFTKNFSMVIAAVLAITLDPAIRLLFTRLDPFTFRPRWLCRMVNAILVGTIHSEERHPISRPLMRLYQPVVELVLRVPGLVIALAILVVVAHSPDLPASRLGIHAPAERRHDLAHAYGLAWHLSDRGAARAASRRRDPQAVSRSGDGLWQDWPRPHSHRPGAAQHGGNRGYPQTRRRVAARSHVGFAALGNGPRCPPARYAQHLVDADSNPHRDAGHRAFVAYWASRCWGRA